MPQECLPEHKELEKWTTSILSENASKTLNSTISLERGGIYCEEDVTYDAGAYIAALYLSIVALLVLSGEHF